MLALGTETLGLHGFLHPKLSARPGIRPIRACTGTRKCLGTLCRSTFKNVRHQLLHQTNGTSSPESVSRSGRRQCYLQRAGESGQVLWPALSVLPQHPQLLDWDVRGSSLPNLSSICLWTRCPLTQFSEVLLEPERA